MIQNLFDTVINFPIILNNLHISITTSRYFPLSTCVLLISPMKSVNGAQDLNINCLLLSSPCLAVASDTYAVTVIVPLTSMYTLL